VIRPFHSNNNFINEFYMKYSGFEQIRLIGLCVLIVTINNCNSFLLNISYSYCMKIIICLPFSIGN
jgi:hypothetical protein